MPQIVNGHLLGSPGVAGSPGIYILFGAGSPLNSTDPNVQNCAPSSQYHDFANGNLWLRTLTGWQQVSVP